MTGFFAILKKISILADDTTLALKHTANILSDDIAVTAEQSSSFRATRELPAIWAIIKGSFLNKLVILPVIFLLSAFLPEIIIPILITGGVYLSYEGYEKVHEYLSRSNKKTPKEDELSESEVIIQEKINIKEAITTDFVLSIEIVLITLSTVIDNPLVEQIIITSIVSFMATVGVYGVVALIVRLDDIGVWFVKRGKRKVGVFLVRTMGVIIVALGYIGTVAMLLVAGGIFTHNIHSLHDFLGSYINFSGFMYIFTLILEMGISLIVGLIAFMAHKVCIRLQNSFRASVVKEV